MVSRSDSTARRSAMRDSRSFTACRPSRRTLFCCSSASARFKNHSWCCLSVASACRVLYLAATSACFSSFSRLAFSSRRMSSTRVRFSRVSDRRFSVSRRRSLYLETPAASSRNRRSSSGRLSMMRLMVPWPMMA
ncbi:hypothetical protein D3C71_1424950 [compost metagenome]